MGKIDVILKDKVNGLGEKGDIVSVPDGYARNYLIPQGLAEVADAAARQGVIDRNASDAKRQQEELAAAKELKNRIDGQSVDIYAKGGAGGKLFGSVTSQNVADAINAKFGTFIDKKKIKNCSLEDTKIVDTFGTYIYEVKLHNGIVANIRANVKEESQCLNEPSEHCKER